MKSFAWLFLIVSLVCFISGGYLMWEHNDPNRLAFKDFTGNYRNVAIINPPVRVIIKNASIDLPIYPAKITSTLWETTTVGASYLTSSPIPGHVGNSIIYAHNWMSLFGNLVTVRPGDIVEVDYQDKSKEVFTIAYTSVVPSDASSILAASKDKRITLYTCTGFLDTKRFVAVAVLRGS